MRNALFVISEWGYRGEELIGPLEVCDQAGYKTDYDYLDGTGFEGPHALEGSKKGFGDGWINFGPPFYPLEYILRDAVGPEGQFHGNVGRRTSVIVDYLFITSRSTASSVECGQALVRVLEDGLRRYGW